MKSTRSSACKDPILESRDSPMARHSHKISESLNTKCDYKIEPITIEDSQEVLDFLKTFFFKDAPLCRSLDLDGCIQLEDYALRFIPENCSFKAVNSDNKIIGVRLNGFNRKMPPTDTPHKLADDCQHKELWKILSLMDFIGSKFNIFDLYPDVGTVLEGKILCVATNYRGLGIAGRLVERTIEYLKDHKIAVYHVLCTSHFAARVLEKLNFHEVFTLPFSSFVDDDGKQILSPAPPHVATRIFVKEI